MVYHHNLKVKYGISVYARFVPIVPPVSSTHSPTYSTKRLASDAMQASIWRWHLVLYVFPSDPHTGLVSIVTSQFVGHCGVSVTTEPSSHWILWSTVPSMIHIGFTVIDLRKREEEKRRSWLVIVDLFFARLSCASRNKPVRSFRLWCIVGWGHEGYHAQTQWGYPPWPRDPVTPWPRDLWHNFELPNWLIVNSYLAVPLSLL